MKNHYVLFAVTLILLSCDSHKNSKLQVNDFRHAMSPQHIAIDFEDCRVYTISIGDTVYMNLETWSLVDSAAQGGIIYHNPVNLKSYQSQLKKQELDSMYYWVKMLIINPVNPKNFCTDYVGNVRFKIRYSQQVEQGCSYTSVCRWDSLSIETVKLNKLLKRKFKDF